MALSVLLSDESLRIIPPALWARVRARRAQVRRTWPGAKGKPGFSKEQRGRAASYPDSLLSGAMVCGVCKRGIVLVSGRHGGYYGCVAARVRGCENRVRVRRDLAEKIIVNALQERLADPRAIRYVFEQLQEEIARLSADVPDLIRRRKEQLGRERRRLDNLVNFIADGRASAAVRDGLEKTEQTVSLLKAQVAELTRTSSGFRVPFLRTIEQRCKNLRALLDSSIERSALVVRELLAPIRLDPVVSDSGRRYYVARTTFDTLKLLEDLDPDGVRIQVRLLVVGGGGGSRTRVRRPSAEGIYMLVRP